MFESSCDVCHLCSYILVSMQLHDSCHVRSYTRCLSCMQLLVVPVTDAATRDACHECSYTWCLSRMQLHVMPVMNAATRDAGHVCIYTWCLSCMQLHVMPVMNAGEELEPPSSHFLPLAWYVHIFSNDTSAWASRRGCVWGVYICQPWKFSV